MQLVQSHHCFQGEQRIYKVRSEALLGHTQFSIYLPPQALAGEACKAVFFLAGLTCNEETFAIKAHAQHRAAELSLILISPDTSPRGEDVAQGDHWDIGQGAGFYINATEQPWAEHFNMEQYICQELYPLLLENFPIRKDAVGIMGHSMGGHGALTLAWKYPNLFHSVSAFAPICAPIACAWGKKAFSQYLGDNTETWKVHDARELVLARGALFKQVLIDQGLNDQFYTQLNPTLYKHACELVGQNLILNQHSGYDHGYYFIQTFMPNHLDFHAEQLQ